LRRISSSWTCFPCPFPRPLSPFPCQQLSNVSNQRISLQLVSAIRDTGHNLFRISLRLVV
jgi:hypothetical protein